MAVDQQDLPGSAPAVDGGVRAAATRRRGWIVVSLLVLLMIVNYADKVVVGLAGVGMKDELGLDDARFGIIQSSFFWLFAVGAVLGGWLGAKVKARWLLAGIALVWVISLVPLTARVGFTAVVACRMVLGLVEGPSMALAMQVVHSWFPAHKRAVPSSIIVAGAGIGPVIANPVLSGVITAYDWHAAFLVLAVFGAVVAVLWTIGGKAGPEAAGGHGSKTGAVALPERVPLSRLFGTGTFLGFSLLFFVAYAYTAITVSWLPLYLREGLGMDATKAGFQAALPYLGAVIAVVVVGIVSTALTGSGVSGRVTRGILPALLVAVAGLSTVAVATMDAGPLLMGMIVLGACLNSAGYGAAFAGLGDIAPAGQRSIVFGVFTAVYSLGGILAPLILGRLVASAETTAAGYGHGFLILGITMGVGGAAAYFLIDPERDIAKLAALASPAAGLPAADPTARTAELDPAGPVPSQG